MFDATWNDLNFVEIDPRSLKYSSKLKIINVLLKCDVRPKHGFPEFHSVLDKEKLQLTFINEKTKKKKARK